MPGPERDHRPADRGAGARAGAHLGDQLHVVAVGDRLPGRDPFCDCLDHVDGLKLLGHRLRPRGGQQPVDQPRQPGDLLLRACQLGRGGRGGVGGEQVEAEPERGKRGPELVRGVGQHRPVPVHQRLEPPRHHVEGGGHPAQLRRPVAGPCADGQVAVGDLARGGVERRQRPADPAGEVDRDQHGGRQRHPGQHDQVEPEVGDVLVERAGGPFEDHGPDLDAGHLSGAVDGRDRVDRALGQLGGGGALLVGRLADEPVVNVIRRRAMGEPGLRLLSLVQDQHLVAVARGVLDRL